jgi:DNA polymerase III epsilon subunit-like protein
LRKCRLRWLGHSTVCTLSLSWATLPALSSYKLGSVATALRVPGGKGHRALADARQVKDIFLRLLHRTRDVRRLDGLFGLVPPREPDDCGIREASVPRGLATIGRAIKAKGCVRIVYEGGSKGLEPRGILPRGFIQYEGTTYLVAHCGIDGRDKMFCCDRIRRVLSR